jgi:hypothetical protein
VPAPPAVGLPGSLKPGLDVMASFSSAAAYTQRLPEGAVGASAEPVQMVGRHDLLDLSFFHFFESDGFFASCVDVMNVAFVQRRRQLDRERGDRYA